MKTVRQLPGYAPDFGWPQLADASEVHFDDLVVPARPTDPVTLHLVLPEGRVRGGLADGETGAPLAEDGPRWWAFLRDAQTEDIVAELQGGRQGATFELSGVPAGRYHLILMARGFFDHRTPAFDVGVGETRELGPILLERSAVLAVNVTGPGGEAVDAFRVSVDGAELHGWQGYERSPGRARWDGLAAGPASVTVSAEGMVSTEKVVTLVAGTAVEADFELVSE